ncbi:MAG: hypothetical protein ABWY11_20890 [Umezawaea sp.]
MTPYQGEVRPNTFAAPPLAAHELSPAQATRPKEIDTSALFWFGAIVLGLFSVVLSFLVIDQAALDEVKAKALADNPTITAEQYDATLNTLKFVGAGLLVVVYGLWLMFVLFMRSGKNWARIVLAVLSGLWLITTLIGIASAGGIGIVLDVIQIALVVAAVYFMFRPSANAYFAPRRVG